MDKANYPAVIALNGPPDSGKTHIAKYLSRVIPDATVMYPSAQLYSMMQEQGLAPVGMLYSDYKRLPESREALIEASSLFRGRDYRVFERRITASDVYHNARVVIIDNVGHVPDELDWYERHARAVLLLRIDTPYEEAEPHKAQSRRLNALWENDSRKPVLHKNMLTAYDSLQMILLLEWLQRPLLRWEAGPYYELKDLWTRYYKASESVGDLFGAA